MKQLMLKHYLVTSQSLQHTSCIHSYRLVVAIYLSLESSWTMYSAPHFITQVRHVDLQIINQHLTAIQKHHRADDTLYQVADNVFVQP